MSASAVPQVNENQIVLTTSDNATIPVDREVAERSILIKNLLEDLGVDNTESIPIPNVRICSIYHGTDYPLIARRSTRLS